MIQQNSEDWLKLRKNYLGASDAPIVMGVSPYKTRYQLWQEKLGLGGEQVETEAMRYGKRMEEPARQAYEAYTGNSVPAQVVFHPNKKFMMASLDGLNLEKQVVVEIKNANTIDHEMAKAGKVPEKYFPQVQHQLACLNFNMLHYFSYRDGDFALVEVERDVAYIETLYLEEEKYWDKNILGLETPELTDRDFVLFDDKEWDTLAKEWNNISDRLAILEKKEKEFRAALIARAAGQNAKGSGICLTKIVRKGTVDYKRVPELIGIDLERYRKEPSESWRLTCKS